ncbi:hypothetical protein CF64_44160 [Bradyrhizobium japonicum]|nr:hypothetical protein CF64_44160 [Bradyrhizobium japonicum]
MILPTLRVGIILTMRKFGLSWRAPSDGRLRETKTTVWSSQKEEGHDDEANKKEGRVIRPLFERHAKGDLD